MGKSLNQVVREYLESLAARDDVDGEIAELRQLSASSGGAAAGWKLDRDELHGRA